MKLLFQLKFILQKSIKSREFMEIENKQNQIKNDNKDYQIFQNIQVQEKINLIVSKFYNQTISQAQKNQCQSPTSLIKVKQLQKDKQQEKTKKERKKTENNITIQTTPLKQNKIKSIWTELKQQFKIPEEAVLNLLRLNQKLILKIIQKIAKLPFNQKSQQLLKTVLQCIDPSMFFLQSLIKLLVPSLQQSNTQVNTLNIVLYTLNVHLRQLQTIFSQQTPMNMLLDSYIEIYGNEGIVSDQFSRWPFQKSGTITLWYYMYNETQQCKLFQILNSEGIGFQIILKGKKIYFQKIFQQKKFRLIKNNSAYLCEAIWQQNVKLSVSFEIKKKFFQPYFSINVISNNFLMTNVEVDSISHTRNDFVISMFKNSFYGKFYSALILTANLSQQVDELSSKGFIYQNDIKNFTYIFQNDMKNTLLLYSAIRAVTIYQYKFQSQKHQQENLIKDSQIQSEDQIELKEEITIQSKSQIQQDQSFKKKQEKQIIYLSQNCIYPLRVPLYTQMFDAINRHNSKIKKGQVYKNISIKKQITNYGGLRSYLPFLDLIKNCCHPEDQRYKKSLNLYLSLLKSFFLNKTQAIEQAYKLHLFDILTQFLQQTKMVGFDDQFICSFKQIYVSLNTRMMRQSFIKQFVWGLNAALYLEESQFELYIKFIKTFYNQDIQSCLNTFGIRNIINFVLDKLDQSNCCFQHTRNSIDNNVKNGNIKNYFKILKEYFSIIENILLIKRNQFIDLQKLIKEVLNIFNLNVSACFLEAFVLFLSQLFSKDTFIQKTFITLMNSNNYKLSVYTCLAYSYSWKTKTKLIQLILHIYGLNIIKEFSDVEKPQKHFISICIRFPLTLHLPVRQSSIQSQQKQYSMDQSEQKMSFNSANLKQYTTIKTIDQQDNDLLTEEDIARVIIQWSFSNQIINLMSQSQFLNPGISILVQIYKGSTYKIRKYITNLLLQNIKLIKFDGDLMASFIQYLLVCQYDRQKLQNKDELMLNEVNQTKENLLRLICSYKTDFQSAQETQLSIIKLILASVKTKYSSQVSILSNRIYLMISDLTFKKCLEFLKQQEWKQQSKLNFQCQKVISNSYKTLIQYFCERGQEDQQMQFQEQTLQNAQKQSKIMLSILQKILELLIFMTAPKNLTILNQLNGTRNKFIVGLLFTQKKQQSVSFLCFVFVILQTMFQNFQDFNVSQRKIILTLIKKYLIFMIQITQNSNDFQIDIIQQQLKNIFLNTLSFLQNKYYQYFYYGFDKIKKLQFSVQNRIRKNVEDLKKMIFNIFLELIELIKQIDDIGSMEHKSFYELMKPKRKNANRTNVKNFYPQVWKRQDQKIIQFTSLSIQLLRQQAKQKLQAHLIQKRLSMVSSSIQKQITKKIDSFIKVQKKIKLVNQKSSAHYHIKRQSQKCKNLADHQEQITVFKYQHGQRQSIEETKRRQNKQKNLRQVANIKRKNWNFNRTFVGLWKNQKFYKFSQNNKQIQYENNLLSYYGRVRSKKQSKYSLTPIIKIIANPIEQFKKKHSEQFFLNQAISSKINQKQQTKQSAFKSQKYLKIGLAFIKKKVIQKIMKKTTFGRESEGSEEQNLIKGQKLFIKGVIWVKPMLICVVNLQINEQSLIFYHQSSHLFQHLSLLKNKQKPHDLLMRQWKIADIQCCQLKKFMLKGSAIEIFFNSRKSIFLSFYGKSQNNFGKFLDLLSRSKKFEPQQKIPYPLRISDPQKCQDKISLTQKWKNRQISNLQYLMSLNILSGRTNCDLNQYFIFPWILRNYENKENILFRNLSLNMGCLGKQQRIQRFRQIKKNIQEGHQNQFPHSHNFGFHYSNIAIVLQYLIRVRPFSQGAQHLQGGKFDIPDRLFSSVKDSFKNATTQMSDIRELIPQFFYFPQFLINTQSFDFGVQQNLKVVNNVELPFGFKNAYDFIESHRQLLQSDEVSEGLNNWIDLIFGYKQLGKDAELNHNKFHYLTYQANVGYLTSLQQGSQEVSLSFKQRESMQSQIAYYGKVPTQLFTKPHPKRNIIEKVHIKNYFKYKKANAFQNFQPKNSIYQSQLIKHSNGFFSLNSNTPLLFHFSKYNKKYLLVRRDWKGLVFYLEKTLTSKQIILNKPSLSLSIDKSFQTLFDKIEGMYIFDETIFYKTLPITTFWCQHLFFGGIWGGKIAKYDILTEKIVFYNKHSDTVTAIYASQQLQLLVTGSINGQIVVWQFLNKLYSTLNSTPNNNNITNIQPKLLYKQKIIPHFSRINSITVNVDLRLAVTSSIDCTISLIDIKKCSIIRKISVGFPVWRTLMLNYPFYNLFIECEQNKQFCYSINGQFLNQSSFKELFLCSQIIKIQHRQLIVCKQRNSFFFMIIKLPSLQILNKIQISPDDNQVYQFLVNVEDNLIQILFNTNLNMVHSCQYLNKAEN